MLIYTIVIGCMFVLHGLYVKSELQKLRVKVYSDIMDYFIVQSRQNASKEKAKDSNPGLKSKQKSKFSLRLICNNDEI